MEKAVEYFRKKGVKASLAERCGGRGPRLRRRFGDKKSARWSS
jgi:hypothetical protein